MHHVERRLFIADKLRAAHFRQNDARYQEDTSRFFNRLDAIPALIGADAATAWQIDGIEAQRSFIADEVKAHGWPLLLMPSAFTIPSRRHEQHIAFHAARSQRHEMRA